MAVDWLKNRVFYEVYPPSFCDSNGDGIGDIAGIISKLDYIQNMGFNGIWLNACFSSPFCDGGYDVDDYLKVAARYGTNEDMSNLFVECHKRDIKVILYLVAGHTSDKHEWFVKSSVDDKNEFANRYIWTNSVWQPATGERYVGGMAQRDGNYVINFFNFQPALNYGFANPKYDYQQSWDSVDALKTRDALFDIMLFWLKMGCDGFRVDMADSLVKNDPTKQYTCRVWLDIKSRLLQTYPEAALVSEWGNPTVSVSQAMFDCDFMLNHVGQGYKSLFRNFDGEVDKSYFNKTSHTSICEFLQEYIPSYDSVLGIGYVGLTSGNHDTCRLSRHLSQREIQLALGFILTMPGVPFVYYGDEIGLLGVDKLPSKEGAYDRTACRTPFMWDNSANAGFSTASSDKLYLPISNIKDAPRASSQLLDAYSTLNVVRKLIKLRADNEELQADANFAVVYAEEKSSLFIYERSRYVVVINPSDEAIKLPIKVSGKVVFKIGDGIEDGIVNAQSLCVVQANG